MTCCPTCGADTSKVARRGGLEAHENPAAVFWRGRRLALQPAMASMLFLLIRRGFASIDAFHEHAPQGGDSRHLAAVRVCHMRSALRSAGVPARIVSMQGAGYRLDMDPEEGA